MESIILRKHIRNELPEIFFTMYMSQLRITG